MHLIYPDVSLRNESDTGRRRAYFYGRLSDWTPDVSRTPSVIGIWSNARVLAAIGGILGLVFARWGVSILLSMLPLPVIPEGLAFRADARVLGSAEAVSLASALLFGLAPAWRATQVELAAVLRSSQGSTSTRTRRLGRSLVACQAGLSALLLVGAGSFVQTLRNLARLAVGSIPTICCRSCSTATGAGTGRDRSAHSIACYSSACLQSPVCSR